MNKINCFYFQNTPQEIELVNKGVYITTVEKLTDNTFCFIFKFADSDQLPYPWSEIRFVIEATVMDRDNILDLFDYLNVVNISDLSCLFRSAIGDVQVIEIPVPQQE